jgi:hypothetical protein
MFMPFAKWLVSQIVSRCGWIHWGWITRQCPLLLAPLLLIGQPLCRDFWRHNHPAFVWHLWRLVNTIRVYVAGWFGGTCRLITGRHCIVDRGRCHGIQTHAITRTDH